MPSSTSPARLQPYIGRQASVAPDEENSRPLRVRLNRSRSPMPPAGARRTGAQARNASVAPYPAFRDPPALLRPAVSRIVARQFDRFTERRSAQPVPSAATSSSPLRRLQAATLNDAAHTTARPPAARVAPVADNPYVRLTTHLVPQNIIGRQNGFGATTLEVERTPQGTFAPSTAASLHQRYQRFADLPFEAFEAFTLDAHLITLPELDFGSDFEDDIEAQTAPLCALAQWSSAHSEAHKVRAALHDVAAWHTNLDDASAVIIHPEIAQNSMCPISHKAACCIEHPVVVFTGQVPHIYEAQDLLEWMQHSLAADPWCLAATHPLDRSALSLHMLHAVRFTTRLSLERL